MYSCACQSISVGEREKLKVVCVLVYVRLA